MSNDMTQLFGGETLEDGRFRWKSEWHKKLAYTYGYRGCAFPFDDPHDDCSHWFRGDK